jgi:hypothetical protein
MDIEQVFTHLDLAGLSRYVDSKAEESLVLDFKTVSKSDLSNADDRRNFAIALSGFANSSGGVIVWGVDARKQGGHGADVAVALRKIDDLPLFVSRLNDLTGSSVSPIVEGVRTKAIEVADGQGYALTIVPESEVGPHMAQNREGRYYKRSGSSFYAMEHFDIADMFGRRRRPHLQVVVKLTGRTGGSRSSAGIEHSNAIAVFLHNVGRGSARNLFVRVSVNDPYWISSTGPEPDGRGGLSRVSDVSNTEKILRADSNVVLYPGLEQGVIAIGFKYDIHTPMFADLRVRLQIAAEDLPLFETEATLSGADIRQAVYRKDV